MKSRRRKSAIFGSVVASVVSVLVSSSCQSTPGTTGGAQECVYGQTIRCLPEDGSSIECWQTCLPDLSAYGPCVCGDGGAPDGGKRDAH